MSCDPIVARARQLIGAPFRLHGRDPETGLDCVGVVAVLYGWSGVAPDDYALRNSLSSRWVQLLDELAVRRGESQPRAGDIVLLHVGPAQYHVGVWTGDGLIHADAGLRRVVEMPGAIPWPIITVWHAPKEIK